MPKQTKKEIAVEKSESIKQAPIEATSEPVKKRAIKKKAAPKDISGDGDVVAPAPVVDAAPVAPITTPVIESEAKPEKKKKKLRHFRVLTDEIDPETGKIIARGRYSGTKPKQAANKAYTAINKEETKKNGGVVPLDVKTEFRIIESTRAIKEPKAEQLDENGQVIPSTRTAKGLQGKKKNKNKNKKTKSIYSYTGCRIILPKEQEVPLRDLSKSLGFIDVVKNVKNKKTGEITQVTVSKEQFPPLYEEVEKMENGVLVKKLEQKTVIYRYKNDVKKKKVEKNAIHVDNILEIEDEVKVGKKPRGVKGNKGGKAGNKEGKASNKEVNATVTATPAQAPIPAASNKKSKGKSSATDAPKTAAPSVNEPAKPSRKTKKAENTAPVTAAPVITPSEPKTTKTAKTSPKSNAPKSKETKKSGKSKPASSAAAVTVSA